MATDEKKDFIDRKVDGVVKIFGLADKNFMAFLLTVSILLNVWQLYDSRSTERNLNDRIIEEVRRQSAPIIRAEAEKQLTPYAHKIDTTIAEIKEKLSLKTQTDEK